MTGKELKIKLIENGVTAEELAKKLNLATKTIYNWMAKERLGKVEEIAVNHILNKK